MSASHALHPPALTCRRRIDRLNNRSRSGSSLLIVGKDFFSSIIKSVLLQAERLCLEVKEIECSGQDWWHAPQKMHLPRSKDSFVPVFVIADTGHTEIQSEHCAPHLEEETSGKPLNRSGRIGGFFGYPAVL